MKSKIKTIRGRVHRLLEKDPRQRDDDLLLIATIWYNDLPEHLQKTSIPFLECLRSGKLTNPEAIRRARQKLQEEMLSLRGKSYRNRHNEAKEVASYLKDDF